MPETVIDYTDSFDCVAAHGRGRDVLILRRMKSPLKRFDGKKAAYEVEYRWLSVACQNEKDEAWARARGQEFTYWQAQEFDMKKGRENLFEVFRLFP